jgi:hypothetical protein
MIETDRSGNSIISEIARHLDLNSLHDLSRTCRQFRANLLQHRRQLIPHTLRCVSDISAPLQKSEISSTEAEDTWITHGPAGIRIPRMTSGKFGACARDMVGECRRCGIIVCRVSCLSDTQNMTEVITNPTLPELHNQNTLKHSPKVPPSKTLPHMHQSTSVPSYNHPLRTHPTTLQRRFLVTSIFIS